jgi:hypothetical protein
MYSCIEFGLSDEGIEYPSVQIRPLLFHEEGVGSFGSAHLEGAVDSLITGTVLWKEIQIADEVQGPSCSRKGVNGGSTRIASIVMPCPLLMDNKKCGHGL